MFDRQRFSRAVYTGLLSIAAIKVYADGTAVDKIYHPYVEPLEWELEWRMTHEDEISGTGEKERQRHRLGVGTAVAENLFLEGYLIGQRSRGEDLDLRAYEIEMLWQMSEQGEFIADYGLLLEVEKEEREDSWDSAALLLLEKEFGRFSGTANLGLHFEGGGKIADEWESTLSLQARYRYSQRLEPALEFYGGEDTRALGPVLAGREKLGVRRGLCWEIGLLFALDSDTPDYTLRALLEYEF